MALTLRCHCARADLAALKVKLVCPTAPKQPVRNPRLALSPPSLRAVVRTGTGRPNQVEFSSELFNSKQND